MSKQLVLAVLLSSVLLTVATVFVLPVAAQDPERPLKPDELQAFERREKARKELNIPTLRLGEWNVSPNDPVKPLKDKVVTTKAELRSEWRRAWAANQDYLKQLEANGFRAPGSDEPLDGWDFEAEREWIESLPEGPVELTADMTEVGVGSSKYGIYTYNTSGGRVDPINAMWVGNGSDEQVRWDLLNVTSPTWESTGCGGTQRARIDDSIHTGGYYTEKRQDTQLEHHGGICGERRYHVRLFGSVVRDSHGTNGWWTIGDAHEDATGHRCARDFTGARRHLEEAYRRSDGSYMFFVDDIYYIWYGNFNFDGGCDGANHNGYGVVFVIN